MNRTVLFALCLTFLLATSATAAESSAQGKQVYEKTCVACHGSGLAGAPKFGDEEAWEKRLEKGMDTLVNHAINGFQGDAGFMPAKGGNSALSNAEVEAAVRYMVGKSR